MGVGDWIRGFFSRKANPALTALEAFGRARKGVEGFIEPLTATNPITLLLVDRDGDSRRAPVRSAEDAVAFCERLGVPVYDAAVIGYPKRMRDFERGRGRAPADDLDRRFEEIERRFRDE